MSRRARWTNHLWAASGFRAEAAFEQASHSLAETQSAYLVKLLREQANTAWGSDHALNRMQNVSDFRSAIPCSDYEDYTDYIRDIMEGRSDVLTRQPVRLLEPSSGTRSGIKWIPYTDRLREEFNRGIQVWIRHLFRSTPMAARGPAYWAVSPAMELPNVESSIPTGFASDAEYLGFAGRMLERWVMAVPASVRNHTDIAGWRHATSVHLLHCKDLALISVWNASFFSQLLDAIEGADSEGLIRELHDRHSRERAREIEHILTTPEQGPIGLRIWPKLALVSCWSSAWAATGAQALMARLPQAKLQPKGLLSTEAMVTIPIQVDGTWQHVLSPCSHFYEFEDESSGKLLLAHELSLHQIVRVMITTGGGLYRYRLHDRVRVSGHYRQLPLLEFLGKVACVTDLVGEKLHEDQVIDVMAGTLKGSDWFLAPELRTPGYILFVRGRALSPEILTKLEGRLKQNPHYAYALKLGQLESLRALCLDEAHWLRYEAHAARGRKSTSKHIYLEQPGKWMDLLEPGITPFS